MFALALGLLVAANPPAIIADRTTAQIVTTENACLDRGGINTAMATITAVRVDGNAAVLTFTLGDTGRHTAYLAKLTDGWKCLGLTGGVVNAYALRAMAQSYQRAHVVRSTAQLQGLASGSRGRTTLRPQKPLSLKRAATAAVHPAAPPLQ